MSDDPLLSEIIPAAPGNADHIADLRDILTVAAPIPLVPFIGAGLTVEMGVPGWTKFLQTLAAECGQTTQVEDLLSNSEYEQAAAQSGRRFWHEADGIHSARLFRERKRAPPDRQ